MTVPALFAPKNSATQSAEDAVPIWQMLVCLNHAPRCPFEMEPGEVTGPPSHERLRKSEQHPPPPPPHTANSPPHPPPPPLRNRAPQPAPQHPAPHTPHPSQPHPHPHK